MPDIPPSPPVPPRERTMRTLGIILLILLLLFIGFLLYRSAATSSSSVSTTYYFPGGNSAGQTETVPSDGSDSAPTDSVVSGAIPVASAAEAGSGLGSGTAAAPATGATPKILFHDAATALNFAVLSSWGPGNYTVTKTNEARTPGTIKGPLYTLKIHRDADGNIPVCDTSIVVYKDGTEQRRNILLTLNGYQLQGTQTCNGYFFSSP
jgi:hypothetical protein